MLTRRRFAGFASCAICAAAGFVATDASAQVGTPVTANGVTRTTLSQMDGPMPGYVTINMLVEVEPNTVVMRHMHPGIGDKKAKLAITYVVEKGKPLVIPVPG